MEEHTQTCMMSGGILVDILECNDKNELKWFSTVNLECQISAK